MAAPEFEGNTVRSAGLPEVREYMEIPIEKKAAQDLVKEWETELEALKLVEESNPKWEWQPIQNRLERLHALAQEIHSKKAQERAKWQP